MRTFRKLGSLLVAVCVALVLSGSAEALAASARQGTVKVQSSGFSILSSGLEVQTLKTLSPEDLVATLLGGGVEVRNVQYRGANVASGTFSGGDGIIGFESGVLLTSGYARNVIGPNEHSDTTGDNGLPGDSDLNALVGGGTADASVLTFEFKPTTDVISFEYVFGSEEYEEWVDSTYNDVFAFFVNGQNMALIPGTSTYVSINTVNQNTNSQYYISNVNGAYNTELDGFTTVLYIEAPVNPGEWNTMKLAIADRGDMWWDSAVFIRAGSLVSEPIPDWPDDAELSVFEVCGVVTLSWPEATGAVEYDVHVNGSLVASTSELSVSLTDLSPMTTYTFQVYAKNSAGNANVPLSVTYTTSTFSTDAAVAWLAPDGTDTVPSGGTYDIQFRWSNCAGDIHDPSVTIKVRDAVTNRLIAGFVYGNDITYEDGVYTQPFDTARYQLQPGTRLTIMVYFGNKLRSTAELLVGP